LRENKRVMSPLVPGANPRDPSSKTRFKPRFFSET
jgi:hypothetical protein